MTEKAKQRHVLGYHSREMVLMRWKVWQVKKDQGHWSEGRAILWLSDQQPETSRTGQQKGPTLAQEMSTLRS